MNKRSKCCSRADGSYEVVDLECMGVDVNGNYVYRLNGLCPFCKKDVQVEIVRPARLKIKEKK